MEPKLIKEEVPDRDTGSSSCSSNSKEPPRGGRQPTPPAHSEGGGGHATRTPRSKGATKERVKTPDSPEGAHLILSSAGGNSNSTSPTTAAISSSTTTLRYATQSGLTTALQNGANGQSVRTGNVSPVLNGSGASGGSLSPPLPPSAVLSLSLLDSHVHGTSNSGRTLGKMKRFLSTLVQFGNDIAPDTGDRVRALVFSLVSNSITIEEFHHSLQDVTNFPLRPFVVPFLRAHLPLLQRELNNLARLAKQSPQQYLRHHEHVVLDPAFSPSEPSEIFHSDVTENGKRRASDSYYENGLAGSAETCSGEYLPTPKRHHPHSSSSHLLLQHGGGLLFSPGAGAGGSAASSHPHVPPPPHLHPSTDYPQQYGYVPYPGAAHCNPRESNADLLADRRHGDEEWKNIHVMLNCILSMVEKTKRALAILQHRGAGSVENGAAGSGNSANDWLRRSAPTDASEARDIKRTAGEIMAQTIRVTEDRVAEVKRRAGNNEQMTYSFSIPRSPRPSSLLLNLVFLSLFFLSMLLSAIPPLFITNNIVNTTFLSDPC